MERAKETTLVRVSVHEVGAHRAERHVGALGLQLRPVDQRRHRISQLLVRQPGHRDHEGEQQHQRKGRWAGPQQCCGEHRERRMQRDLHPASQQVSERHDGTAQPEARGHHTVLARGGQRHGAAQQQQHEEPVQLMPFDRNGSVGVLPATGAHPPRAEPHHAGRDGKRCGRANGERPDGRLVKPRAAGHRSRHQQGGMSDDGQGASQQRDTTRAAPIAGVR